MVGSLIKWSVIGLLVILVPWLAIPVAIYIAWRFGLFKNRKLRAHGGSIMSRIRMRDRISKFNVTSSGELRKCSADYTYYIPCDDSPFALLPDSGRFRCISAFVITDRAGSDVNYRRAVNEAVKLLSNGSSKVVLTLSISNGSEVGCRIQVAEPCPQGVGEGWFRCLGEAVSDKAGSLSSVVHSLSPSLRVRTCRGWQILQSPLTDEGGTDF